MEPGRPTWLEIRNLFPTGYLALTGLLIADATVPQADLWHKTWFLASLAASALLIAVGLFGFIAHYKLRSIPLVLIAIAAVGLILHLSTLILGVIGLATFFATLVFLSDEKGSPIPKEREGALEQKRAAQVQADEYKRQREEAERKLAEAERKIVALEAKHDPGPIYFYQEVEIPKTDPRWLVLRQTTEKIRALNPFFYDVKKLEGAEQRLSAAQSQIEALKKQNENDVKLEAAKYESQIEALLKACAEREQERDAVRAQLSELRSLSHERYFSRKTLRLADVVAEGGILRDKTFEECTLQGPAVVHFGPGFSNQDPSFTNGNGKLFLISDRVTPGIVYIRDCRFIRCTFANVAVLATEEEAAEFKKRSGMEHLDI